ncbi:MAG: HlyD family type I secretion periplasmic adaptor subunit [Reyranella sp.]|jgi:HlyD family type I secretion membrane fusion protein|uniref:HlyD family type I secretion periplasmic adaptor subunit n=1 Tax=Reyranella sp. TaxID=1929291 RepID=UPI0025F177A5|nr:HlyD family type I secretion periplasmic adaptor subunit [Reyranella sp.]MBR2819898.1 HlyD family type I secretion periplasmic adaptor subunit [Reyranella sp.]
MTAAQRTETTPTGLAPLPPADWQRVARVGRAIVILGFGVFVGWASLARLDGAAVSSGVVAVESYRKTVQHLEGGIVREILVRDGDVVAEGQVLLRLDPTRVDAQSEAYRSQVAALQAQETRLLVERDVGSVLSFPAEVVRRSADPTVAAVITDQKQVFEVRRAALLGNLSVADAQIEQARKEAEQNTSDLATARATYDNVVGELVPLRGLLQQKLVAVSRVMPLEREKLRLEGVIASGELQAKKLNERLTEAELKRKQVLSDYRQESSTQLLDVRRQLSDARQQLVVAEDAQRRYELKAPIAGTVQQMRIFTVGGVIRPGDPVLDIVPTTDTLVIQAKISPLDVDRVTPGMPAEIRFPSFRYFGADIITGSLRSVSRDRLIEDASREPYFAAEVTVDRSSIPAVFANRLTAGIPADVVIPTEPRSVMSYLLTPIYERFDKSMRER